MSKWNNATQRGEAINGEKSGDSGEIAGSGDLIICAMQGQYWFFIVYMTLKHLQLVYKKPWITIMGGNVISSMFASVLYDFPCYPRWYPRCLSLPAPNLLFIISFLWQQQPHFSMLLKSFSLGIPHLEAWQKIKTLNIRAWIPRTSLIFLVSLVKF